VIYEIGNKNEKIKKGSNNNTRSSAEATNIDNSLANYVLVITDGPTREPIDQVRFISNASSGKMGVALAEEALSKGAKSVCLIHGPGVVVPYALRSNERVKIESVVTSQEMQNAVLSSFSEKGGEILISAGAPADYSLSPSNGKISTTTKPTLKLELKATKKIIGVAKKKFPKTFVVAFKAEPGLNSEEPRFRKVLQALKTSGADMVVANDIARSDIGFGSDYNQVSIVTKDGNLTNLPRQTKNETAREILEILAKEIHRF
jgi:phosphopantothenoylcysteine decarboxylase/phosphopantothenate--cysteine ligase